MTYRQNLMAKEIRYTEHNRLSLDEARAKNQLIFGSLCKRRWVEYKATKSGEGYFYVSKLGCVEMDKLRDWSTDRTKVDGEIGIRVRQAINTIVRRMKWTDREKRLQTKSRKTT